MPVVRTDGRVGGRSVYGHVITKFSRMGSLPHFLPKMLRCARFARESSAKSGSRSFSACNTLIFFQYNPWEWSFSLQFVFYFILFYLFIYFFRTAVLWKLFDTRFSYKHCNFPTPVCLPIMQDGVETVTRSITACKPLTWNLCHVGPLLRVEFLMSSEHRPILAYKSTD